MKECSKSLKLVKCLLVDMSRRCNVDTNRDFLSLCNRVENEGLSFLTIALPQFEKQLLSCIENGGVLRHDFPGFGKHDKLPKFLGGFLRLIFDSSTGLLLAHPSIDAIFAIRSITLLFKKVLISCSPDRVEQALDRYVECENELATFDPQGSIEFRDFGIVSDFLIPKLFASLEAKICSNELVGRHGPGTTAERILGNKKYDFKTWNTRLDSVFPYDSYGVVSFNFLDKCLSSVKFVEPGAELPVRVITVPKTLKAPRIIAVEPVAMQYCQQALLDGIRPLIERNRITGGQINFSDQTVNQRLAASGSKDGLTTTLDLSDASDRVSAILVYRMLHSLPVFRQAVFACRSTKANVPRRGTITLSKFASMGSALCFEMESLVFFTILVSSIIRAKRLRFDSSSISAVASEVYVYGDDLVVPTDTTFSVIDGLERLKLKVNLSKTFSRSRFRESCGSDYYDGVSVKPVYLRHLEPESRADVSAVTSWVSTANQLFLSGSWVAADYVRSLVEDLMNIRLPFGTERTAGLCWYSFKGIRTMQKFDEATHSFKARSLVVTQKLPRNSASSHGSLLKCLGRQGNVPIYDPFHLERSGRPLRLDINVRWVGH